MKELTIVVFVVSILTSGCDKKKNPNDSLQGKWIESELKTDTIQFQNCTGLLWLSRGTETRNGHNLPKIGSGPYSYYIQDDSIHLQDQLSSAIMDITCYFKIEDDKLIIGNFYDETLDKTLLDFIQVK